MHRPNRVLFSLAMASWILQLAADPGAADEPRAATLMPAGVRPVAPDAEDADLLLWLDASDRATLTTAPDGRVSAWSNKAAKVGRKLTSSGEQQPLYVAQALGGRPAVRFDGIDDVLRDVAFGQSAQTWTAVLVVTPRSNSGNGQFRALLATNRPGQDDFQTGLNLDLGPGGTEQFSALNLEGIKDAPGAANLRTESAPFGEGQIITISTGSGRSRLWINGAEEGGRAANDAVTAMDELRVGGRFYLRQERGYFDGDVSEILIYKTQLTDARWAALYAHLLQKYGPDIKQPAVPTLLEAWDYLPRYDWGSARRPLEPVEEALRHALTDAQARAALESRFIATLSDARATPAAKDYICRRLATIGSAASVPALAKLLSDERLSNMACFALERIPDPAADEALRRALTEVPAKLRVGAINAVGNRRSQAAVVDLARWLPSDDAATAQAAATALGKLGGPAAAEALMAALDTAPAPARATLVDSCLKCAEQFRALGQSPEALALYDKLCGAHVPERARLAAARGALLVRGVAAVPLVIEHLKSDEPQRQAMALRLIRELPGTDATRTLAAQLSSLPPDRQARMIVALADRHDPAATPAVLVAVQCDQAAVRLAAVETLRRLGDAAVVPVLLAAAASGEGQVAEAAASSLAMIPGQQVDAAVLETLSHGDAKSRQVAVDVLGRRAYVSATPALIAYARSTEGPLRLAAIKALGETAAAGDVPALVDILVEAKDTREMAAAETAIATVHQRLDEPALCSEQLAARLAQAGPAAKLALLRTLGRMGCGQALPALQAAVGDPDAEVQDTALRALCDWPNAEPADGLLKTARESSNERHRLLALRGYLHMAGQEAVPAAQRLVMCQAALRLAQRDDERRVALGVLARAPSLEALAVVLPFLAADPLKEEAGAAAVAIGDKLLPNHRAQVGDAMDQVLKTVKNEDLLRRATEVRGRAK